ncbi:hypothetical protein EDB87DRAFT_1317423 [Lactarius vividus]|nr:hypothetical protein EDB87DRAFT_1317423 [Lactarius vividus]
MRFTNPGLTSTCTTRGCAFCAFRNRYLHFCSTVICSALLLGISALLRDHLVDVHKIHKHGIEIRFQPNQGRHPLSSERFSASAMFAAREAQMRLSLRSRASVTATFVEPARRLHSSPRPQHVSSPLPDRCTRDPHARHRDTVPAQLWARCAELVMLARARSSLAAGPPTSGARARARDGEGERWLH